MKILNLYAGIGGNRRLWKNVDVTAIENNPKIAAIYQDFFPNDKVIVGDAHAYLLEHYKEFDFIWSSPPCPTHSRMNIPNVSSDSVRTGNHLREAKYIDMSLYQEIILLKHFHKLRTKWCIENVISYYEPLIKPTEICRHYFWSNFFISDINFEPINVARVKGNDVVYGFNLKGKDCGHRKDQVLRNCVNPKLGLHILNESKRDLQPELFK